jgi:hypothetical protein
MERRILKHGGGSDFISTEYLNRDESVLFSVAKPGPEEDGIQVGNVSSPYRTVRLGTCDTD